MLARKPFYKKVDRSLLEWGITIPKEYIEDFLGGEAIELGKARKIEISFNGKNYFADLRNINRKAGKVYQLRWDNSKDLLLSLRKTFIQSYVVLKGQKELFDSDNTEGKYFRSKLESKQQEVLCLRPITPSKVDLSVFIKIEDDWNPLFERLADENVFGWLFDKDKRYLISRSTEWLDVCEFQKHKDAVNVIYYLANSKRKTLYIGKAEILSKRVKPGRDHQGMKGDWDKFRYDIVHKEYAGILERIEDHTIRSIASILNNARKDFSLNLSEYRLVNKNWKRL